MSTKHHDHTRHDVTLRGSVGSLAQGRGHTRFLITVIDPWSMMLDGTCLLSLECVGDFLKD